MSSRCRGVLVQVLDKEGTSLGLVWGYHLNIGV